MEEWKRWELTGGRSLFSNSSGAYSNILTPDFLLIEIRLTLRVGVSTMELDRSSSRAWQNQSSIPDALSGKAALSGHGRDMWESLAIITWLTETGFSRRLGQFQSGVRQDKAERSP